MAYPKPLAEPKVTQLAFMRIVHFAMATLSCARVAPQTGVRVQPTRSTAALPHRCVPPPHSRVHAPPTRSSYHQGADRWREVPSVAEQLLQHSSLPCTRTLAVVAPSASKRGRWCHTGVVGGDMRAYPTAVTCPRTPPPDR